MSPSKGQATSAHSLSSTCSLVSVSFLCLLLLFPYPLSLQRSVRFREVSHTPHCLTATKKKRDIHGASVLRHRIVTGPCFVYVCLFLKNYKPDTKRMTREVFLLSPCHVSSLSPASRGIPLCCRWASARSGTQGLGKERSTWWNLLHLLNKCNLNLVMHFTILILKRNLETISFPISLARTPVYGRQNLSLEPARPLCELVSCEHNTEPMEEHRSSD